MKNSTSNNIISMQNIHLEYHKTKALKGVDFQLREGEIHALAGAHRAGKSSLVKLLSGVVRKQSGKIFFREQPIDYFTPKSALKHKIGTVYQYLNVIPALTATENIFAGRMKSTWYWGINYKKMEEKTKELLALLELDFICTIPIDRLSLADQHMVEVARALSLDPDILILDEISSKLTPDEMKKIYQIILKMKARGKSVIFITHNVDEIFEYADRVTILNEGLKIDTENINDLDKIKLLKLTYSSGSGTETLKKVNKELFYLKKYNENIIKNIPIGVLILDIHQNVYLVNFAALKILKLSNHNVTGHSVQEILDRRPFEGMEDCLQAINDRQDLLLDEVNVTENTVLKISVIPFKDEDYVFQGTIILLEDTSTDHFLKSYILRNEKISSVAELAAGVAHEINNPLGIVQNYLELLKLKEFENDTTLKLGKIENEISRINKTTKSLLSFTKFHEVPESQINLTIVIDEVLLLLDHKLKAKNIKPEFLTDLSSIPIIGEENKLIQLFMNLINNSIEAVEESGLIKITAHIDYAVKYVDINILDNGEGIPEDIINNIFDPFFSTKSNRQNTGLGLSICQHIMEIHNGLIQCERVGNQTCFRLRFPLDEEDEK